MNKNYFKLFIFIIGVHFGFAQNQDNVSVIKDYLVTSGMDQKDVSDLEIQSQSFSKSMNLTNVYVVQTYNGIPIKNTIGNFAVKNGKVVHFSGKLINDLQSKVNTVSAQLSATNAVQKAAIALNLTDVGNATIINKSSNSKFTVSKSNVSVDEIPVELIYEFKDDQLLLSWDLSIHAKDGENWYSVRIDANSGEMISKDNWMTKCTFDHNTSIKKKTNTKANTNKTHSFGFGFNSKSESSPLLMEGTYNVFKIPAVESPNHGGRTIETNPANVVASPFGWHDTDGAAGAEFTTTQGNNVRAAEDLNGNNFPGNQPDGGANLVFDYPYDPTATVSTYQNASLTNLFYASNVVHDVWYQYGFDEASGNFQLNNYGNGGAGGDEVIADGQDGSGFNNANFGTPPDGANPRMQMFLWSPLNSEVKLEVNNTSLAGEYRALNNNFDPGKVNPPDEASPLTADLVLAIDDSPNPDPNDICSTIVNATDINGNIAVVRRGSCDFTAKVIACQNAGALAVIVVNNVAGDITMGGGDDQVAIPAVSISSADGEAIINLISTETINVSLGFVGETAPEDLIVTADGSFDNGIVIHEYGHGISTRLTGGAANSGCLSGDEQMGEGWSDWFALMMTIEAGDTSTDIRGIGTYATAQPTTGRGIRPFPYSTDMTINPVTYDNVKDEDDFSVPHGVGSIWASILWDMTWAFIERDGFDSDLYNGTGGNNLAMQLVIDGLKLQACNPGFVDGRDGILAAADLLPNSDDNKCLIWSVFAKRGVGFSASQGFPTSRTDQTPAFDVPPTSELDCTNFTLGVDDVNEGVFQIYPNPSTGAFDIRVAENVGNSTISIFDINGRVVYKDETVLTSTHRIQTNLRSGIYLLRIEAENGTAISTSKIVIQ
ncbi:T9SS C-terminal target domain-containing protein [Aquimarina sp. BL5]|uniref:T9SS-dependent M36 family metallopeptidase n=1 Tax=Aquimarina sp. BL5 TaxID=1714860 RepID=UPI000E4953C9|nr:T9SS-dependent M36 family metallopeptidase [Aquimarina sp. BL5]AXT51567.1 T9SS C-terminal target domain-containing protein [Aquimarina sp. BL5]RKN09142.1 T9SS C-terminal target domain-containing protein [Aquimarina sp. BL5]